MGVDQRDARAERRGQLTADVLRMIGDDHRRLGLVQALDDEVDCLDADGVGHDGVQRQHPAAHDDPGDDVEEGVVGHHKRADGHAQTAGEDHGQHLDAVERAAVADGGARADARDQAAEDGAQQQVAAGDGRRARRDEAAEERGGQRVDHDGVDRADGERRTLAPQAVEKERHVEHNQKEREGNDPARNLGKQHRRARNAAVIQRDGREKQHHAERVDDAGDGQHQQGNGGKRPAQPGKQHAGPERIPEFGHIITSFYPS